MYAIRSYYAPCMGRELRTEFDCDDGPPPRQLACRLAGAATDLEDRGAGRQAAQLGKVRITSYNVCYTKLLRERIL